MTGIPASTAALRRRHYRDFYSAAADTAADAVADDRPLWLVIGNCQAEALRLVLDGVPGRPFRTVRMPPVHEMEAGDLPALRALLGRAAVLLCQPIRPGYRDLPLGSAELAAELPRGSLVVRWPVIRYAGLYPFQVIVRRPADRSIVPPAVPYHDLRTVLAALDGRGPGDPWDVEVSAERLLGLAEYSRAELATREQRQTDVSVSDLLAGAGADAAHAINHPGNSILRALGERILTELGTPGTPVLPAEPLLGAVYAPLESRVLDALGLSVEPRREWRLDGATLSPEHVHRVQLRWYDRNPDFPRLAVERHRGALDVLGLRSGVVGS